MGVLVLAGPTASGKTDLAVELAQRFGAEIVGADSRQIYRGMPIGTAAPSAEQLAAVPHHLVGFLDPRERYSAARFAADATSAVETIEARGKRAIVVGGTGFYIRALTGAVSLAAQYDPALRERLARESRIHEAAFLHQWLLVRDPGRAAVLHPGDTYRVVRALEVALSATVNGDAAAHRNLRTAGIPFLKLWIEIDGAELERRIAQRADAMLERGLVEEAARIGEAAVAADAVGYPQALAYLRGWSTLGELRAALVRATRRYAKRQRSWFRTEPQTRAVHPSDLERMAKENLGWV